MGTRITDLSSPEFARLFTAFEYTAYRLELHQVYDVGYERDSYAAFLAGRPIPDDPARAAWAGVIRNAAAVGKRFTRVHVVREPLSDYLRYEGEVWYRSNVAAGDDVPILPAETWPADAPHHDYWLFDSRDLWVMNYSADGTFEYAQRRADIDAGWVVADAGYWRDFALHRAIPFTSYHQEA